MSAPSETVRLPLAELPEPSFGTYVKLAGEPPAAKDLVALGVAWAAKHASEPIRGMIGALLASGLVTVRVFPKAEGPNPPVNMLRAMRMGAEEERRMTEATHFVLVLAPLPLKDPPLHVFAASALASGLALAFDGVVLDFQVPRLVPVAQLEAAPPADGRVHVVDQIVCPMSVSQDRGGWMTTKGMRRFGLPELEMRSIPPNLGEVLPLMNGVAQVIVRNALLQASRAEGKALTSIELPAEIEVTQHDLVAAFGQGEAGEERTTVRLTWNGVGQGGLEPFVSVGPPASHRGDVGEWYYTALSELLGRQQSDRVVQADAKDEALARAQARALAEWPEIRARFERGLVPDEKLFVKRGFPIAESDGAEFMWVAVLALPPGEVTGTLANDSAYDETLRAGKQVTFSDEEIFDWMLVRGEAREGGYSIDALRG